MRRAVIASGLVLSLGLAACSRSSTDDIIEWSPADHDHQQGAVAPRPGPPSAGPTATPGAAPGQAKRPTEILAEHGVNDLVLASWKQNCSRCHGLIGRGDGADSAGLGVRDLTDPAWQETTSDADIRQAILKGVGTMPAFGDLPAETATGMVRLVRLLGRAGQRRPSAAASTTTAQP